LEKIIKGLGYGLDEEAINTIENKWRFIPFMLNGQPIDIIADIDALLTPEGIADWVLFS
jgi:hypothetical protein